MTSLPYSSLSIFCPSLLVEYSGTCFVRSCILLLGYIKSQICIYLHALFCVCLLFHHCSHFPRFCSCCLLSSFWPLCCKHKKTYEKSQHFPSVWCKMWLFTKAINEGVHWAATNLIIIGFFFSLSFKQEQKKKQKKLRVQEFDLFKCLFVWPKSKNLII